MTIWSVLAVIVLLVSFGVAEGSTPKKSSASGPTVSTTTAPTTPATSAPVSAVPVDAAQAGPSTALSLLATVVVKGRAAMTGYTRDQFGDAWTDDNDDLLGHNGCDTRDDILRRDLTQVKLIASSNGCTVDSGSLDDPYTNTVIAFTRGDTTSVAIEIDHVVPLGDAWQMGAQQWSLQKRVDLANDPLNLLAVSGPQNEAKGDGDAATWLPPNKAYRCAYVSRQVAVKARYGLAATQAEHDAIASILAACPTQLAPTEAGTPPAVVASTSAEPTPPQTTQPVAAPATTTAVVPLPASPASSAPPAATYVTPGAYCSNAGATGLTSTGKVERCETTATDSRLRWRAA